jgi:hypothetical protein
MFSRLATGRIMASLTLGLLLTALSPAHAADIYVSPTGDPKAQGTRSNPIDLATALSSSASPAKPGDTIILLEGRYDGPMNGIKRVPFELTVSGKEGAPIIIRPEEGKFAHLNGTVAFTADYVHLVGLDIGDLNWDLMREKHDASTAMNVTKAKESKAINCNIFGGSMGTGIWTPAINFELYGCIIHDFGGIHDKGKGRGSGHAVYTQNKDGTKHYRHNVFYRGAGWNLDIYTQQGEVRGFDVIENISYIAGYYKPGQVSFSYGVMGWKPAARIRFIGNVAYQPRDGQPWRSNMRILGHYNPELEHEDALVKDNYIMGAFRAFSAGRIKDLTLTGNTFWSTGVLMEIASAPAGSGISNNEAGKPDLKHYKLTNNTYYANGNDRPFRYGAGVEKGPDDELISFSEWQKLGVDTDSKLVTGKNNKPSGTKVFVFPNTYQPGRANVGVFNWDGKDSVEVDLSTALKQGQKYAIYNLLDINQTIAQAKPVVTGTFNGKAITLPLRKESYSPDFDAFLVLPVQ